MYRLLKLIRAIHFLEKKRNASTSLFFVSMWPFRAGVTVEQVWKLVYFSQTKSKQIKNSAPTHVKDSSHAHIHLLTPLCRVKKFPAFHGTRRFITALTSVRHLSLSWASPIQSLYPHPTSWRSILILYTHLSLGLPSGLLPFGFLTKILYTPLSSPIHATCPVHLILLDFSPAQYWVRSTNHLAPRYAISSTLPLPRPS